MNKPKSEQPTEDAKAKRGWWFSVTFLIIVV